jgi:hypothetical protein
VWAMYNHPALRLLPSHCWRHATHAAGLRLTAILHQPISAGWALLSPAELPLLLCLGVSGAHELQGHCTCDCALVQGDFEAFLKWVAYPFIPSKSAMYQPGNNSSWPKVQLDNLTVHHQQTFTMLQLNLLI